jgi:hypothetical protein
MLQYMLHSIDAKGPGNDPGPFASDYFCCWLFE